MILGLRRSVLYVPGDSEKMLHKAAGLAADVLLLNLEDGVSPDRKDEARAFVARALGSVDYGRKEVVVRINPAESETGRRDLAAVAACRPDGICLPKVESPAALEAADAALSELERANGLPERGIRFHAMIESASGVLNAPAIAAAPRMAGLLFGSADYVAEMRCRPGQDRAELLPVLHGMVLAARAAGIDAVDGPCFDLGDEDLLRREAEQARRIGMDGKSALHPAQVEVIHRAFAVGAEEIAWARRVLDELDRAEERGRALSTLDGRLIDNPHRAAAEQVLRRAALASE